ncbi:hypothetical protein RRG08_065856 [Elysia crispata]|uniref:Proline dehydrogenase n=1 Tax=Elysia crispata TaxID=231223 RepID=A0AAE1A7Y7_9GAST|nr:hypothetical protein RRG08_065856 [Elysia crispata]
MLMMSKYYKTASLCSYHMHVALSDSQKKLQVGLQLFQLSQKRDLTLARSHHFKREKSSFVKRVPQNIDEIGHDDSLSKNKQEAKRTDISKKENIFEDYRLAYRTKSTWELSRALGIFLICRFPSFADNALRMIELSYRVLGKRFTDLLVGRTVYTQFVAGETSQEMADSIARLRRGGVGPILCCPTECYSEHTGMAEEEFYDLNLSKVLASIDMAAVLVDPYPMVQYKYTAFISGQLMTEISPLCQKTIHNPDVIYGILAAMEGQFVDFAKLPGWESFPVEKSGAFLTGLTRIGQINKELQKHDIIALTDAEYINMNPGLRLLGLCSMKQCNSGQRAKVFYTYQAYLKRTAKELAEDLHFAKTSGFTFGVKLVRGAYMVQERERAKAGGYPDPINDNFEATCQSYASCLDILLNEAALTSDQHSTSKVRFITASHNEDSVLYALQRMEELRIPKDGGDVFFGQLYGMADHLSFSLGSMGYFTYKSMPYGSLSDTLPYLSRRAQENKAILVNARRERNLILKTLRDRALLRG